MQMIFSLLIFLLSIGSVVNQKPDDVQEIRFNTSSRGYQKSTIIRPDSTIIREQGMKTGEQEVKRKTSEAEWHRLMEAIPDDPLTKLEQLEGPSMGRASDRARHSRITIKTATGEYSSAEFDNENPHQKLMPLMKAILKMEERKP